MTIENTLRRLMADASGSGDRRHSVEARQMARVAWVQQFMSDLRAAQGAASDAWDRMIDGLADDVDDEAIDALSPPPEQDVYDALLAQAKAIRDHDRWPKALYWGGI